MKNNYEGLIPLNSVLPTNPQKSGVRKPQMIGLQEDSQAKTFTPQPSQQATPHPIDQSAFVIPPLMRLPHSDQGKHDVRLSASQLHTLPQTPRISGQIADKTIPETPPIQETSLSRISLSDRNTFSLPAILRPTLLRMNQRVEFESILGRMHLLQYLCCVAVWLGVNAYFWIWWLNPAHRGNLILFCLITLALFYEQTLLPSLYTFFVGQMRRPTLKHEIDIPATVKRVAVISLTVPGSESLEIVKRQMIAMKNISYPHDSWILVDKEHSPTIEKLAKTLGIHYFSRHDMTTWGKEQVAYWNQSVPPFKAKTKAGNVNSWLDAYSDLYSHFTQFDIDHIPVQDYLHKVLKFFADPKVKWVQAPSVYGNLDKWAARGSAEQEFVLHGPLQMGFFGFSRTPFIIGSHCTYDMAAVCEIGGFQPTRAEDHLDTVFLAAKGYEGIFLPEVIATGDGPETFETYLAQQFAWAYSMIQVFFQYTPKRIRYYTPRQTVQFLFVQSWYILWSISMLLLFILPVLSLFTNTSISHVNYWDFLLHSLPITVMAFIIWLWSHPWHFPNGLDLSWRGVVLHIARWPVVLSAFIQVILRVEKPYMITVKGLHVGLKRPFALKPHYPYFALIGVSLAACWYYLAVVGHSDAQGYLFFALQGAAIMLVVYITALYSDIQDLLHDGIALGQCLFLRLKPILVLAGILAVFAGTTVLSAKDIYMAMLTH